MRVAAEKSCDSAGSSARRSAAPICATSAPAAGRSSPSSVSSLAAFGQRERGADADDGGDQGRDRVGLKRIFNRGESALVFTLGTVIGAMVDLTLAGLPALVATDWAALPPIVWITILYTAVFATAASFALTQFASLRIPAANVMAYTYLVPVWVILWGVALGAGGPPVLILPGIALILLALIAILGEDGRS